MNDQPKLKLLVSLWATLSAYQITWLLSLPIIALIALPQLLNSDRRRAWLQRFGVGQGGPPVDWWLHAASLGEADAAMAVARTLLAQDSTLRFHFTCSNRRTRAKLHHAGWSATLMPWDVGFCLRPLLKRAGQIGILEIEIWLGLLAFAAKRGVPVTAVGARMPRPEFQRYRRARRLFAPFMKFYDQVLALTARDAARWHALGVPRTRIQVIGLIKLLMAGSEHGVARRSDLGLVWISVHLDELRANLTALKQALDWTERITLVPRHPHQATKMARWLGRAGLQSRIVNTIPNQPHEPVLIVAAFGVVPEAIERAECLVLGGSWRKHAGCHNVIPLLASGKPVIVGPNLEPYQALLRRHGIRAGWPKAKPGPTPGFRDMLGELASGVRQRLLSALRRIEPPNAEKR